MFGILVGCDEANPSSLNSRTKVKGKPPHIFCLNLVVEL